MARVHAAQTSFTTGEISPKLKARTDMAQYSGGLEYCVNYVLQPFGGVARRSGTRFVAPAKVAGSNVKLIPFEFNDQQAFVLEFGDKYVRFFTKRGQVMDPNNTSQPLEVATPWDTNQALQLQYAQSADVMYLVQQNVAPQKLSRIANDNWTPGRNQFHGQAGGMDG